MQLSSVARNVGINLAGALVPVAVTLITVPIYISRVGLPRYGVILVAWSLLGYLGFLDLGISRATTNLMSKLVEENRRIEQHRVFWSALLVNGAMGAIGGMLVYVAGSMLFRHVLVVSPQVLDEAIAAMPYIAAMLPVALMLGVGVGTLEAHGRFAALNAIQMTGLVLGQLAPLLAVHFFGPDLKIIMPVLLGVRGATFFAVTALAMRTSAIPVRPSFHRSTFRKLVSFGGWVTVSSLISPLLTDIDQFVVGSVLSVGAIPFYSVPMNIISRTQLIPSALTRTLFPIFSRMDARDNAALMARSLEYLGIAMTLLCLNGVILSSAFLGIWLGPAMQAQATPVMQVLFLGAWANNLAFVVFSALQGEGRPRTVALIHSAEVVPYLLLLLLLVHSFGLTGAALAWTCRVGIDAVLLAWAAKLSWRAVKSVVPGLGFVLLSFGLSPFFGAVLWRVLAASFVMSTLFIIVTLAFNRSMANTLLALVRHRPPASACD